MAKKPSKKIVETQPEPKKEKKGSRKAYIRACKVIIELNEKIVAGEDDENDPLWDELAQLRKEVEEDQNAVLGRLVMTLSLGEVATEIDEATPGAQANWKT